MEALRRNDTSFPVQLRALLRDLFRHYRREKERKGDGLANVLRYHQYLVRAVMSDPAYGIAGGLGRPEGNSRGLLVYHVMGIGKTRLAIAVAMALWGVRVPIVLAPKSLHKNFQSSVEEVVALLNPEASPEELKGLQADAARRFKYVTMDAYNMADQLVRATLGVSTRGPRGGVAGTGSLEGKLLIVDEAHNFFRAIINSADEKTNARKLYTMIQEANNLRLLFLTGTPASKDPFELVPCFNMLAGADLLPPLYDTFYQYYVDRKTNEIINRGKLENRLIGMVSHASHVLPTTPEGVPGAAGTGPRADGGFPEELPLNVVRVEMSPEQYRLYLLAREKEEAEGRGGGLFGPPPERISSGPPLALPGAEAESGRSYYTESRRLGNYAPPREHADVVAGLKEVDLSRLPDEAFTAESSPKIAHLVKSLETGPGPALVYSQFVGVGGLGAVARYLRLAGFHEYRPPPEALAQAKREMKEAALEARREERRGGTDETLRRVSGELEEGHRVSEELMRAPRRVGANVRNAGPDDPELARYILGRAEAPNVKRYAVISGEVPEATRVAIVRAWNSPANKHGGLIWALLVSKTGAEGLDLKYGREVYILEPYWDKSREDQVVSRLVRLGSHDALPPEEREVQPYLYVATANREVLDGIPAGSRKEEKTIDERFHARALEKAALNAKFRRMLKEVALECSLNRWGSSPGGADPGCPSCGLTCRICNPTGETLFHPDPGRDLRLPDPCEPLEEGEIEAAPLEFEGTTFYFQPDPTSPLGFRFFRWDPDLEAYSPVEPSETIFPRLAAAAKKR